jgi:hypothetical protein
MQSQYVEFDKSIKIVEFFILLLTQLYGYFGRWVMSFEANQALNIWELDAIIKRETITEHKRKRDRAERATDFLVKQISTFCSGHLPSSPYMFEWAYTQLQLKCLSSPDVINSLWRWHTYCTLLLLIVRFSSLAIFLSWAKIWRILQCHASTKLHFRHAWISLWLRKLSRDENLSMEGSFDLGRESSFQISVDTFYWTPHDCL